MSKPGTSDYLSAIKLLESGLSYYIPRSGRCQAEDALRFLRNGRTESGYEALAEAACVSDGMAHHFLTEARSLLAPERVSSC